MACILKPYGEVVQSPFEAVHTEESVTKLANKIFGLEGEVKVVLGATGAYHLPLLKYFFREENICKYHKSFSDEDGY